MWFYWIFEMHMYVGVCHGTDMVRGGLVDSAISSHLYVVPGTQSGHQVCAALVLLPPASSPALCCIFLKIVSLRFLFIRVCVHTTMYKWRSEDHLWLLSLNPVGPGIKLRESVLTASTLPMNHLTRPIVSS